MTTIAIIGAGKGLGLAAARRFGQEGHSVALIARNQDNLDSLVSTLTSEGITAQGFSADVRDTASLQAALDEAVEQLGPIEVLQYSPVPEKGFMRPVLETAAEDLTGPVELSIYGPVTAARRSFRACGCSGAGPFSSSTAPARSGPAGRLPAPPSLSPVRAPTPSSSTKPSPLKEFT